MFSINIKKMEIKYSNKGKEKEESRKINILAFDLPQDFFAKIFPKYIEVKQTKYGKIQKNKRKIGFFDNIFSKNNLNVNWDGYKYPDLNQNNYKDMLIDIYNKIEENIDKKYIIIKFGKSFINEFAHVINKIKADKSLILFNLQKGDEINENSFKKFNQP